MEELDVSQHIFKEPKVFEPLIARLHSDSADHGNQLGFARKILEYAVNGTVSQLTVLVGVALRIALSDWELDALNF